MQQIKSTMNQISDEAILEGIKLRSQFIVSHLYEELFPFLSKFVQANSGTEEDAEDIFQEALIVVYQKLSSLDFELTSSFKSFFFGVSRMLWLRKITSSDIDDEMVDLDEVFTASALAHESDIAQELKLDTDVMMMGLYQKYFLKLNEECQQVLRLSMRKVSQKEIAEELGITVNYVKTRKFMCKKQLIENIKNDPQYKNYFEYEK